MKRSRSDHVLPFETEHDPFANKDASHAKPASSDKVDDSKAASACDGPGLQSLPSELLAKIVRHVGPLEALLRARLWAVCKQFLQVFESDAVEWSELPIAAAVGGEAPRDVLVASRLARRGLLRGVRCVSLSVELMQESFAGPGAAALVSLLQSAREPAGLGVRAVRVTASFQKQSCAAVGELIVASLSALRGANVTEYSFTGDVAEPDDPEGYRIGVSPNLWRELLGDGLPGLTTLLLQRTPIVDTRQLQTIVEALPGLRRLAVTMARADEERLYPLASLPLLSDLSVTLAPLDPPAPAAPVSLPPSGLPALRRLAVDGGYVDLAGVARCCGGLEFLDVQLGEWHGAPGQAESLGRLPRLRELRAVLRSDGAGLTEALAAALGAAPSLEALRVGFAFLAPDADEAGGRGGGGGSARLARVAAAGRRALRSWVYPSDPRFLPRALSVEEASALAACERLERVTLRHAFEPSGSSPAPYAYLATLRRAHAALGPLLRSPAFGERLWVAAPAGRVEQMRAALRGVLPHARFVETAPYPRSSDADAAAGRAE
eukprot:tig00000459_g1097.t1